jgi:putative nucleotidyltransferase with HDIG domain
VRPQPIIRFLDRGVRRVRTSRIVIAGRERFVAVGIALVACAACAVAFALLPHGRMFDPLAFVLAGLALTAGLLSVKDRGTLILSATFVCSMLAVAFLGPAPALAIVVFAEAMVWAVERYRLGALAINVAVVGVPSLLAGIVFDRGSTGVAFAVELTAVTLGALALNYVLVNALTALRDVIPLRDAMRPPHELLPTIALNVALTVALAEVQAQVGLAASIFAALVVVAFSYMARLVVSARERAREYAALSWGVLSGLLRTLDERDPRAARHGAAVAAFSRDIAAQLGLAEREQELAHTAGLLHDIGRFALSDRVMERGHELTDPDWRTIRRHSEIGAGLLRDLGLYGPVAEIVRAHHERVDGRGYPDGLGGDEIPLLARIVAVAEVYDTLTADDTYRTPMTSFEALTELRRVAARQLDPVCVEALAQLLSGRGLEYRHADAADYDRELDIERRMNEAGGV